MYDETLFVVPSFRGASVGRSILLPDLKKTFSKLSIAVSDSGGYPLVWSRQRMSSLAQYLHKVNTSAPNRTSSYRHKNSFKAPPLVFPLSPPSLPSAAAKFPAKNWLDRREAEPLTTCLPTTCNNWQHIYLRHIWILIWYLQVWSISCLLSRNQSSCFPHKYRYIIYKFLSCYGCVYVEGWIRNKENWNHKFIKYSGWVPSNVKTLYPYFWFTLYF